MGKLNLLKSSYIGKVGQTYGVEQYNNTYVKAVPFSHTPHNAKQRNAKNAFVLLNRMSANIAKYFWKFLNLSDKDKYKNNAVAQWLKTCLENNEFILDNIENVIPKDNSLQLVDFTIDYSTAYFEIKLKNNVTSENVEEEKIYISIITNKAISKITKIETGINILASGYLDFQNVVYIRLFCFKSIPWYKKRKIQGLILDKKIYIIIVNHVWYVLRLSWSFTPYVENHTLFLPKDTIIIQNGTLYLR